jgi:uncharacterized protein YciI
VSKLKSFRYNHTLNVFQTIDVDADSYEEAEEKYLAEKNYFEIPHHKDNVFYGMADGEPDQNWEFINETSGTYAFKQNFPVEQEIIIEAETLEEANKIYEADEFLWSADTSEGVRVSDMYEEISFQEVDELFKYTFERTVDVVQEVTVEAKSPEEAQYILENDGSVSNESGTHYSIDVMEHREFDARSTYLENQPELELVGGAA